MLGEWLEDSPFCCKVVDSEVCEARAGQVLTNQGHMANGLDFLDAMELPSGLHLGGGHFGALYAYRLLLLELRVILRLDNSRH